jgi:hypothetical protein
MLRSTMIDPPEPMPPMRRRLRETVNEHNIGVYGRLGCLLTTR